MDRVNEAETKVEQPLYEYADGLKNRVPILGRELPADERARIARETAAAIQELRARMPAAGGRAG